jgi:large repetitive protein
MRSTALALILTLFSFAIFAQAPSRFSARQAGWWTLGLDGGLAFQTADVRTQWNGGGFGLTLAKNLAYRPGGLLSFDARGRFLLSRTYGASAKRSFGLLKNESLNGSQNNLPNYLIDKSAPNDSSFVFANYKHGMGELGLEGVLTFNRLRERTGVVFSLFGGLGLDFYRTTIDQAGGGNPYNYLNVDAAAGRRTVLADLGALRDGDYETDADGMGDAWVKAAIMPGAGVELGYQVTQRFVIGIGHKITFSRTDALDGQRWTDANLATSRNDWHHYTNLHFRWDLGRRTRKAQPPQIEITWPGDNPSTTSFRDATIRARIRHVNNYSDIQCLVNGTNQPFQFKNGLFSTSARLREGRNEVRITASNTAGSDEASTIINVVDDRVTPPPPPPPSSTLQKPEVRITLPSRSPQTTNRDNININASIRRVDNRRNVRLTVNGSEQSFNFAEGLEANVRLREGKNIVRVEATNEAGRDADEVEVIYERDEAPAGKKPTVTLTQPRSGSESSTEKEYTVKATITNVESRDDITLYVNGSTTRNFTFTISNGSFFATIPLKTGENDVTIRAKNRYGEADASCIIKKNSGINIDRKPEVRILQPTDGSTTEKPDADLKADVKNTSDRSQVKVFLNGRAFTDFDYDKVRQSISGRLKLAEGSNTIAVSATTTEGSDEASAKVTYKQPAPVAAKPEVRITEPASSGNVVKSPTATLRATTKNVASRNEVKVELNGKGIAFEFSRSGEVSANLDLREGDNSIRVTVQNSGGNAEASTAIRYEKAQAPTVQISKPANNSESSTAEADLVATVRNITAKSQVTVQLNGKSIDFQLADRSGQVTAKLLLKEGTNNIIVRAQTDAGSDEATVNVRYIAAKLPVVRITAPADKSTTDQAECNLKATLENVTGLENVEVTIGRTQVKDFFIDRGGNLNAKITLNEGKNLIRVKGTNKAGSDEASVLVTLTAPPKLDKPEVTITDPRRLGAKTDKTPYTVKATVKNAEKDGIKVTVNGKAEPNFSFDPKTMLLTFKARLASGRNTVKVEATNATGTGTASAEIFLETPPPPGGLAPEIKIESASQPVVSPFSPNQAKTQVLATTRNVTDKSQISCSIDGRPITDFSFDTPTGKIDLVVSVVRNATNLIAITVTTPSGTQTDTRKVKFE